jgi:MFS family permease
MKISISKNFIPLVVIIGGCVLLLVSFGIRHSSGLYLTPISNQLSVGREVFGFAIAIQFLMIGFGSPVFGAIADKYGSGQAALSGVILFIIGLIYVFISRKFFIFNFFTSYIWLRLCWLWHCSCTWCCW